MNENGPRIIRLGPSNSKTEEDDWTPDLTANAGKFEDLIFRPLETSLIANQKASMKIDGSGILELEVRQSHSTPGFRVEKLIVLEKGEYELEVVANSEVERTFFPMVIDSVSRERVTPTFHISSVDEVVSAPFTVSEKSQFVIGVISHRQEIGDLCYIESLTIKKFIDHFSVDQEKSPIVLAERFVPHHRTDLTIEGDVVSVISEAKSTPGAYAIEDVDPGGKVSIHVRAEMSPGCAAFLYVADHSSGKELTRRNVVLGRGGTESIINDERYTFVRIPPDVSTVRIGLLFSTTSTAERYRMRIQHLEVVGVKEFDSMVDHAYVLSLEGDKEKFEVCKRESRRHAISLNRWNAVNGYSPEIKKDWEKYMDSPWTEYDKRLGRKAIDRPGAWGYMLTMEEIFTDAVQRGFDCIAVFDDDFILSKSFTHDLSRFLQQVGENWDVLYLGASQWAWDGIEVSPRRGHYSPTVNTNGSFAVIYKSSIFEDLIFQIRKMDAPFDSGPLGSLVTSEFKGSSFVSFPNIAIANVEKPGIRDSRSQTEYAKRFRWKLQDFPPWFTEWSSEPSLLREEWPWEFEQEKANKVVGVTTFNRKDYLTGFIESFEETISEDDNWCLIVADDGSTDGTIEWLLTEFEPAGYGFVLIRNDLLGIARQSNSIIEKMMQMGDSVDVLFMCNDDIRFEKEGWSDLYFESMGKNGIGHLVYFNPEWKDPILDEYIGGEFPLKACVDARNVMGCFYTITPEIVERIGYFDEESFPVRGHSHIDYTIRACRAGFNDSGMVFDALDSNEYISMEKREGYIGTHRVLGIWESEQVYSEESLKNRESLLEDGERLYIERGW